MIEVSIMPALDDAQQPRDGILLAFAGSPPRVVASAARVAGGPSWVVVGFGDAHGFQAVTGDVRATLVAVAEQAGA